MAVAATTGATANVPVRHDAHDAQTDAPPPPICTPNPCQHGAVCSTNRRNYALSRFYCACPVGWSGVTCEVQALIAPAFSSDMVVQAHTPTATIYGNANATTPGDTIHITVAMATGAAPTQTHTSAVAKADGSWSASLGNLPYSTTGMTITATSGRLGTVQVLEDVLAGDVYICSGQSNMALPVSGGSLPLLPNITEAMAKNYPYMRLLNNGHFWPPTPSHPGGTALGRQTGDRPGWQVPTFGNGSYASQGTVANFSAVCWFMGTTLSDYTNRSRPIGLISTDAGGTSIHRWVSQEATAASSCSQVTPTSTQSMGGDIGTLFEPMVSPLAQMAVSGFTWYQGEANECPKAFPVHTGGPCGGTYYACTLQTLITSWRKAFTNSPADAPFLINELGALQDTAWPVLRQAMHQAVAGVSNAAVIANADMGTTGGRRTAEGLPSGAMHSGRKINLGRRNGLAMLGLQHQPLPTPFHAPYYTGPVLEQATITPPTHDAPGVYTVAMTFSTATAGGLHFHGAAECIACCGSKNGSAVQVRVVNATDMTGYTWQRSASPTVVNGNTVTAAFTPDPANAVVDTTQLRFMYEGEPECVLYNGVGGPDDGTAIASSPFYVDLKPTGAWSLVPAPPCPTMVRNATTGKEQCYFAPEPCSGYRSNVTGAPNTCPMDHCCWDPITNKGQCEPKGSKGCNRSRP